ncbi:DUF2948 family protein [Rhizobiaceae bacterium BDR2-2]|uniref:DUF2948 family protein n=1 Tax=Ectorhizobium quercum TaxID=2965071 RepID=A0AAE3STU6_9HYPH|nr:DUF2948 family protein [Ectorhizobium quercum]MCX8996023.1 DUF2948 family protein [Ectorhizobium quercum]
MTDLKLLALDAEDLSIVSAHVQDSVFKTKDMSYKPGGGQFSLAVNRFVWEEAKRGAKSFERCRAALVFKRVNAVRLSGVDRRRAEDVLSLLAIRFAPNGEGPDGTVELTLAGGRAVALDVECIELQFADIGGAWETERKPDHSVSQ